MSDTQNGDPAADEQPDDAEDQAANEQSEAEQKLANAESRATDAETRADTYARALFEARVAATGKLADPTDMPFSAELLDDADAFTAAIDALLAAKPHLANRRPAWGDVGAGQTTHTEGGPTWADLFKRH